ncbi:MAG: hypothetical protein V3U60_11750, partial [Gammaproteobacteria bacterium]
VYKIKCCVDRLKSPGKAAVKSAGLAYVKAAAFGVRRVKAALSQWVRIPPGNLLQPEATGATVEVTKRFKPPVKRAANMVAARVCRP